MVRFIEINLYKKRFHVLSLANVNHNGTYEGGCKSEKVYHNAVYRLFHRLYCSFPTTCFRQCL